MDVLIKNITIDEIAHHPATFWTNVREKETILRITDSYGLLIKDCELEEIQFEKHGEWTKIEYADEVNGYLIPNYECSQCGYWSREDYDYCPNCGSKMEMEE